MNEAWEFKLFQKYSFENIELIRACGEDHNFDPNYLRALGWYTHAGMETPPEWCYGIFQFTLKGEGKILHHGKEYSLPAGTAFLTYSTDTEVRYWNPCEGSEGWHFVYLEVTGHMIKTLIEEYTQEFGPVFQFNPNSELINQILSLKDYQSSQKLVSTAKQQAIMGLVKESLFYEASVSKSSLVDQALNEVRKSYKAGITVSSLAERLGVSREFLTREFKKELGWSPYQYIQNYRLKEAHELLIYSSLSVKEIAFQLGFSSSTIFSRQFKQHYKISPSELRKLALEN